MAERFHQASTSSQGDPIEDSQWNATVPNSLREPGEQIQPSQWNQQFAYEMVAGAMSNLTDRVSPPKPDPVYSSGDLKSPALSWFYLTTGRTDMDIPSLLPGEQDKEGQTHNFALTDEVARRYVEDKSAVVGISVQTPYGNFVGSGFFAKPDGTIVTDYHVIEDATKITVTTANGTNYAAKVDRMLQRKDLASIKIEPTVAGEPFPTLPLAATANDLKPGDRLYGIGHPHGWSDIYISPGEYMWHGFPRWDSPRERMIEADLNLQKGNSGSAVVDKDGKVVGVCYGAGSVKEGLHTVDDVHQLLGDAPPPAFSDYILPRKLSLTPGSIMPASSFLSTSILLGSGVYRTGAGRMVGAMNGVVGVFGSVVDGLELTQCVRQGAKAEAATWGVNLAADLMLASGFASLAVPRISKVTSILQVTGAGIKLLDQVCKDREY